MQFWIPLGVSVVAVIISVLSWHKNRVVYEIVIEDDRQGTEKLNKLLITKKYTILHVKEDATNRARTLYFLGRIK